MNIVNKLKMRPLIKGMMIKVVSFNVYKYWREGKMSCNIFQEKYRTKVIMKGTMA